MNKKVAEIVFSVPGDFVTLTWTASPVGTARNHVNEKSEERGVPDAGRHQQQQHSWAYGRQDLQRAHGGSGQHERGQQVKVPSALKILVTFPVKTVEVPGRAVV